MGKINVELSTLRFRIIIGLCIVLLPSIFFVYKTIENGFKFELVWFIFLVFYGIFLIWDSMATIKDIRDESL